MLRTEGAVYFPSRRNPRNGRLGKQMKRQKHVIIHRYKADSPSASVDSGNLEDLSIPGVNKILSPKTSLLFKMIWTIAFVCCFVTAILQISLRIKEYLGEPVSIVVERNSVNAFDLPNITICPGVITEFMLSYHRAVKTDSKTLNWFYRLQNLSMSVEEFWNLPWLSENALSITAPCNEVRNKDLVCKFDVKISKELTFRGICFKLFFNTPYAYQGLETKITLKFNNNMGLQTNNIPSMKEDEVDVLADFLQFNSRLGLTISIDDTKIVSLYTSFYLESEVEKSSLTTYTISSKVSKFLNLKRRPCFEEWMVELCVDDCLHKRLTDHMPCRLPFMKSDTPLKNCTMQNLLNAFLMLWELYETKTIFVCDCPKKCSETTYLYSTTVLSEFVSDATEVDLNFENSEEIISEQMMYDVSTLLCDIGGNLGLFLGLCCLSILEVLECIFSSIYDKVKKCCRPGICSQSTKVIVIRERQKY